MVAIADGEVVGACWVRTTDERGHIDDKTPAFSISLYEPYRGQGIGAATTCSLLDRLREAGYDRVSLSTQKENPALRLYERLGFRIVGDRVDETERLMVVDLSMGKVRTAGMQDVGAACRIAQRAIRTIYPRYCKPAIVEAFCKLRSKEAMASDIRLAKVFLLEGDGKPVGAGTLDGCRAKRVFVLPGRHGRG